MKKVMLGVVFGLMASSAFAATDAGTNYFGGSIGRSTLEGSNAASGSLILGHEFRDSAEFGLALETGVTVYQDFHFGEVDVDGFSIPVKMKPTFHIDQVSIAPYMGATFVQAQASVPALSQVAVTDHDTVFTYGIDVGYDLTSDLTAKIGYNVAKTEFMGDSTPLRTVNLQLVTKF